MARDNLALLFVSGGGTTSATSTDVDAKIMVDTEKKVSEKTDTCDKPRIVVDHNVGAQDAPVSTYPPTISPSTTISRSRALAAAGAAALKAKAAATTSTVPLPPPVVESAIKKEDSVTITKMDNDNNILVRLATINNSDLHTNNNVNVTPRATLSAVVNENTALTTSSSTTTPGTESLQYIKQFASPWLTSAVNLGERGRKTVIEKSMTLSPLLSRERATITVVGSVAADASSSSSSGGGGGGNSDLLLNEERANHISSTETETTTPTNTSTTTTDDDVIKSLEEYDKIDEEECKRMKTEAVMACQLASIRYDALLKFVSGCPYGTYEDFVEFLVMGGAMNIEESNDDDNAAVVAEATALAMQEVDDYYGELSEYRQLWNDNLLLGLTIDKESSSTTLQEGRAFVPSRVMTKSPADLDNNNSTYLGYFRDRTLSEGERIKNRIAQVDRQRIKQGLEYAEGALDRFESRLLRWRKEEDVDGGGVATATNNNDTNDDNHRERTLSEEERITNNNNRIGLDRHRIKQGLGSAVNVLTNVSSYALKPLRDIQLAEKLNALNLDMEEEEKRKEIEHYRRQWDTTLRPSSHEEEREMKEMLRMKQEAEDSCLRATTEHLLSFIQDHPDPRNATYQQWIADLHPENAHDGTLLEGLGKTIDHRFFVEESDHRRIWNDNLCTYLSSNEVDKEKDREEDDQEQSHSSLLGGRDYVPARAKQQDQFGHAVVATDILSGSVPGGVIDSSKLLEEFPSSQEDQSRVMNRKMDGDDNLDLIEFVDW